MVIILSLTGLSTYCAFPPLLDSLRCHVDVWHSGAGKGVIFYHSSFYLKILCPNSWSVFFKFYFLYFKACENFHWHIIIIASMSGHSCLHDGVPTPTCQELPHLEPSHAHSQKQNVIEPCLKFRKYIYNLNNKKFLKYWTVWCLSYLDLYL